MPLELPDTAIVAENLRKSYRGVHAVADVSLTVPTGTVLGVLGPNGAGKTTTVRMLATLVRPDAGRAEIFGRDVVDDATAVRSLISLTGQYASLDEDLTAIENLELFARLLGHRGSTARARATELVEQFGLAHAANRPVSGFSGGMRRRVDLAASMISRPALLFLDEPTTGLDPATRTEMWSAVRDLVTQGTTVLLTTQYLDEADQLSDSLVVIDRGSVVATGNADELKDRVGQRTLQVALTEAADLHTAVDVIGRIVGTTPHPSPEAARLSAPIDDPALAARVIAALDAAHITIAEISVERPSLDDVFFAITSRSGTAESSTAESSTSRPSTSGSSTGEPTTPTPEKATA